MGGPTRSERGLAPQLDDPAFLAWARKQGQPVNGGTPARELVELFARYTFGLREARRMQIDKAAAIQARTSAQGTQPFRKPARALSLAAPALTDEQLGKAIERDWKNGNPQLRGLAESDVRHAIPLVRRLETTHDADRDKDRWTYMRAYLRALSMWDGAPPASDANLLDGLLRQEKLFLAARRQQAAQRDADTARARPRSDQLAALTEWARRQPMNPADDFDPGVARYDLESAAKQSNWADADIAAIAQDHDVTTINYRRGEPLRFPSHSLDFDGKHAHAIADGFLRRHTRSGRLVPFVIYARDVDVYRDLPALDQLEARDRLLMALPYMLTPAVAAWYGQNPFYQVAGGLLDIMTILAVGKGALMSAPTVAGGLATTAGTAYGIGTGGFAAANAIAGEVSFAVESFGVVGGAGYLANSAYTFYLVNAVAVNTVVIIGTPVVVDLAGGDVGPVSPGDELVMAIHVGDEVKAGAGSWKAIRAELTAVEAEGGASRAVFRVVKSEVITEQVAQAEYGLGKEARLEVKGAQKAARAVDDRAVAGKGLAAVEDLRVPKPPILPADELAAGRRGVRLAADPRKVVPMGEIEAAMSTVTADLGRLKRLPSKYTPEALNVVASLTAEAIRDAQINPKDLAKLAQSLNRAGATVQRYVNDFHAAPGFEQVLLNWAKRSYWDAKLATPAWKASMAGNVGAGFVMRYSVGRLDPRFVRFEWPVGINDTRWGVEVTARYVDIVVFGGSRVAPGQTLRIELKTWTEEWLRKTARFPPGRSTQIPGKLGYQLLRDVAFFDKQNILWVFDGRKAGLAEVIDAFAKIVRDDAYLREKWGVESVDAKTLRSLLAKIVEIF